MKKNILILCLVASLCITSCSTSSKSGTHEIQSTAVELSENEKEALSKINYIPLIRL